MSDRYSFIPATREQVETIRKKLGTDEEDIKRAITSVRDWLRMQPHLPDEIDDARIERIYVNCKCSIERVKKGLDAYYSLRTRYPEMMMNRDPMGADVVSTMEHIVMLTMPRLTKELYRVHIFADPDPDPTWVSWTNYGKTVSINLDWMLLNDYSLGDVVIMDLKNTTAGHVLRSDINMIRAIEFGYKTAYCRSLKALHLINADKVVDLAMKILKAALSEKLQKRTRRTELSCFLHFVWSLQLSLENGGVCIRRNIGSCRKFNLAECPYTSILQDQRRCLTKWQRNICRMNLEALPVL
ncbi:uncharacterized protein LOC126272025 isoform X2 [Schistocerca gregaria]|uniref:uncharacterized protein LOC126272025 isoform X2 n=1 Tax=Schistocerca gregaria TaxID=7010 RepID=UPI00211DE140|nr:uncharacterized protein LOC126272025 isoform X2 [Schistocerca gregaria]